MNPVISRNNTNLINLDIKNKSCPLKQNVLVKRNGGIFLSVHGAKVEIPPYASTGRRERVLCAAFPSTTRGVIAPWLGSDMRLASEVHMLYSPVKFQIPVAVFIPFTFAATREMSHPSGNISVPTEGVKIPGSTSPMYDTIQSRRTTARLRGKLSYTMHFGDQHQTTPYLIDARSVSLLKCRLGDDQWQIVQKFTIVQPTIPYVNWPLDGCKLMSQAYRWSEPISVLENSMSSSMKLNQRLDDRNNFNSTNSKQFQNIALIDNLSYDFINNIENYCGGVFIHTEELNHCYVLVNSIKAEKFSINSNGGLFFSPILNPFLSIRIPKFACSTFQQTIFKKIKIRNNLLNSLCQFDPQLNEIEGCSDIFDLDLHDIVLKRPATIHLPLPQWYINKYTKPLDYYVQTNLMLKELQLDDSTILSVQCVKTPDSTLFDEDRELVILYQPSNSNKKIVWQNVTVNELNEKQLIEIKSFNDVNYKKFSKCKLTHIFIQLKWSTLLVGLRSDSWQIIKQSINYAKRTISFNSSILGKFVLIGARNSKHMKRNKLEHLMAYIESLTYAPPGALLICLHITATNWQIMANIYPEEKLQETIEHLITTGFIPLIQFSAGIVRKAIGLHNAVLQALECNQSTKSEKSNTISCYRLTGHDINHVQMFNGLCLELRFHGDIHIKPISQFDLYTNCIRNNENIQLINNSTPSPELIATTTTTKSETFDLSTINFDFTTKLHKPIDQLINEKKLEKLSHVELLNKHRRLQLHELLSDTSCIVEIEPIECIEEKYSGRSTIKFQYLSELLNKPTPQATTYQNEDETKKENNGFIEDFVSEYEEAVQIFDNNKMLESTTIKDKSVKDDPPSSTIINQDLFNRFETMIENGEISRSSEFVTKIYELYHVGTVEIWLVPPDDMPQLEIMIDPDVVSNYLKIMSLKSKKLNTMEGTNNHLEKSAIDNSTVTRQLNRNQQSNVERKPLGSLPNKRGIISARSLNTSVYEKSRARR
ncbi:hypothetical protein MN116_003266 [Schistosoma mekongi]|uniref:Uncharacterized protein n=1 Tax=Schistosoma mekongi TaxID=38744 RepID=A0AAE1ZI23_SCHME|nr:hypothetical protein MN116_003266 [Schistosoma mekongi]